LKIEKVEVNMNCFKVLLGTALFLLAGLALSPSVKADQWDKETTVTFDAAVEVPGGVVLPAGTYTFKLLNSPSDRHIVQIFNKEGTHLFATVLAINNFRLKVRGKTVMTFGEREEGRPQAIRAWFYPGDNFGQEFVYPKTRAIEIAKTTNSPVLHMPSELAVKITTPASSPDDEPVIALKQAPIGAVSPAGEDVATSEVVEAPPVQTASIAKPRRLPQTASHLPLVALFGFLSLGAGLALSVYSKRVA